MKPEEPTNKIIIGSFEKELLDISAGYDIKEAVNKEYREIIELLGEEVAAKLYRHFRGCRIDCPKYFYNVDFVIDAASKKEDRREREKIAVACGYTAEWVESKVRKLAEQKEDEDVEQKNCADVRDQEET